MTYKKINAIVRECCLDKVREALVAAGAAGLTVTHVRGAGEYANTFGRDNLSRHARLEVFAEAANVGRLVQAIHTAAHTGQRGDGIIAVLPAEAFVHIRTEEPALPAVTEPEPAGAAPTGGSCCGG
jgi:nitrogen regulatory protein PII